ncbi:chaplin [Streptomyces caniferus]|uniref:chaplin n=1 Tax=Streptomyces caniferus TaxID=285557 RepID=UPI00340098C5
MNRFTKTAATAAVGCAIVLSGAGVATASGDGHHGRNGRYHDRYRSDHRSLFAHRSGANAAGFAAGSPGVLSGNNIQIPINIPINVCGNSHSITSLLNPAFGNICINR